MNAHLRLGKLFLATGRLIQSMAIMTMKPDDLVRFGREAYGRSVPEWSSKDIFEPGDLLWGNIEFIHAFWNRKEVEEEFEKAALKVISFHIFPEWHRAAAILTPSHSNHDKL
jgi:hypothetical protein